MRKFLTYIIILFCIGITHRLSAQKKNSAFNPDLFKHVTFLYFSGNLNLTDKRAVTLHLSPAQNLPVLYLKPGSVKDLPFFCALEFRVHQQTNLWIKLRAGDDESYMKMIRSREK